MMHSDVILDAILYHVADNRRLRTNAGTKRASGRPAGRRSNSRRTTLTLPQELLREAERLARQRHQTLSTVIAGLLQEALRTADQAAQRPARILRMWKKAFAPLTEEEMLLVDGIILEDPEKTSE